MSNIKVVPLLLKHRVDKAGKSQIVIRVYLNNSVVYSHKTGKKIEPKHWDTDSRSVKKTYQNHSLLNSFIRKKVSELEGTFLEKELSGHKLTKNKIMVLAKGEDFGQDFIEYCKKRIPERCPKDSQKETRRTYIGEINKLQAFQNNIEFGDLDTHFLSRYKAWLIKERNNSANTIWKSFKFINTMINDAIPAGIIKENPFKDFDRGRYQQGRREFLDLSDCDKIHKVLQGDVPERLRLVGYYYLMMCYTGMRFRDATLFFNYENHVLNDKRIVMITEKYGTEINILIHDRLRMVLDIIKTHPLKISNKEFNSYTKVLATLAGIKEFTAHTGRHTFGATLAQLGVKKERAQKLLGHKDIKSTEIYYHLVAKSLDEEMLKWDQ